MELLQHCRDHAHKYYCDLLIAADKTLADVLFEQAENCTNNEDQRRYFEAMQQLKSHNSAMHTAFKQAIDTHFQTYINGKDTERSLDQHIDLNTLSLVHRDALEDELAISVIVSKANSRNSESLWKLNRRLAVLRGGKNVTDDTNPLAPALICQALQQAVTQLGIEGKAKILIYKQLGKVFVISFGKELDALNELLVDKGILPNLRFSISKSDTQSHYPSGSDAEPRESSVTESASSMAHQQHLYNAIRALQTSSAPRTQTSAGVGFQGLAIDGDGGSNSFSAIDYALALSAIQQSKSFLAAAALNRPMTASKVETQLFDQLLKLGNQASRHKMTRDDADTVDLVGMIFNFMLDDSNLHDSVKSLLSHLHTPYLKLALMDKNFLNHSQHNARALLNLLADMGSKWVKDDKDRTVLPKIKAIVETVLTGFIDDVSIFDRLLEDCIRFKENLEKRAKMVEKRNTEAQQGQEKLELSKQLAAEHITTRLQDAGITNHVSELINRPWADFLAFNLLRHGKESQRWQQALTIVDDVVLCLSPPAAGDKSTTEHHQSKLTASVEHGLNNIGYDPEAANELLHSLTQARQLSAQSPSTTTTQAVDQPAQSMVTTPAITDIPVITSTHSTPESVTTGAETSAIDRQKNPTKSKQPIFTAEEQPFIDKLRDIAFGTWFEFDKEDAITRLKLAWFSQISSHYMFVDNTGVKQSVETLSDLARGMCAGTIRIARPNKKSFMERALESVFNTLQLR